MSKRRGQDSPLQCAPPERPHPRPCPRPNGRFRGASVGEGHDPPGQLQICLAAPSKGTRPPNLSLRGAQRRGNPFLRNAQHCTDHQAGHVSRPALHPSRGAQALRLAEERIATPACALVRNDRFGGAVGLEAGAEVPASQRRGQDPRPTSAWPGPGALSIPCTVGRGLAPAGQLQV